MIPITINNKGPHILGILLSSKRGSRLGANEWTAKITVMHRFFFFFLPNSSFQGTLKNSFSSSQIIVIWSFSTIKELQSRNIMIILMVNLSPRSLIIFQNVPTGKNYLTKKSPLFIYFTFEDSSFYHKPSNKIIDNLQ